MIMVCTSTMDETAGHDRPDVRAARGAAECISIGAVNGDRPMIIADDVDLPPGSKRRANLDKRKAA